MGLGGGEALIPQVNGKLEGVAEGFGKGLGADGLGADVAGKIEGMAEDDLGAAEFAEEAPQGFKVLLVIPANEGQDGLRGEAKLVGDGNADAAGAEIEAQEARFHTSS